MVERTIRNCRLRTASSSSSSSKASISGISTQKQTNKQGTDTARQQQCNKLQFSFSCLFHFRFLVCRSFHFLFFFTLNTKHVSNANFHAANNDKNETSNNTIGLGMHILWGSWGVRLSFTKTISSIRSIVSERLAQERDSMCVFVCMITTTTTTTSTRQQCVLD